MRFMSYEDLPKIRLPNGNDVFISDSTLRDGAQMPGIVITLRDRLRIYEYLHRIGIEKLEVFLFSTTDKMAAREMLDRGYNPEVTGWSRANTNDIDLVLEMDGIRETGILMSVSDPHILIKMGLTGREAAREMYLSALQYAVDHGLRTRAHLEDITRSDLEGFVYPLVRDVIDIDRDCTIRICDTLGYGLPFDGLNDPYSVPSMIRRLRELGVRNIETHIHDDFGFGTANSIVGYWYGANWSSLTFLGIGERAGNAELEKVLLFLKTRVEGFEKYDLSCLTEFAQFMEERVGIRVPRNKAVVGRNIFSHESGIHTAGVIKNPFTYEPYPPEIVGATRSLMIGPTSGREVLKLKVEEALRELIDMDVRINKDDWRLNLMHSEIKRLYDEEKRRSCISDEELKAYVEKYFLFESIFENESHKSGDPMPD